MWAESELSGTIDQSVGMTFNYIDFVEIQDRGVDGVGGGADRDRTDDLLNAIQALSQLSYGPTTGRLHDEFCVMHQK
jgi:hypothetical protein